MSQDNIIHPFGSKPTAPEPAKNEPPKTYDIVLESGEVIVESGYLALGGYVAMLGKPNDPLDIKFAAEAGKVRFVRQTDEVIND